MAMAAIPLRRLAVCQPVNAAALMAAPPVEKSAAAIASWMLARGRPGMARR
jgi:hypothetical protein